MAINFRFNTITPRVDSIPEDSLNAQPPMTWDYTYSKNELGDNINTQVKTIVKDSGLKKFERLEEYFIKKEDLEECVKQSIQLYLMMFGASETDVETMFQNFKLDESKEVHYGH
jgi:hypothetical protein